jgi:hypothetical protein
LSPNGGKKTISPTNNSNPTIDDLCLAYLSWAEKDEKKYLP